MISVVIPVFNEEKSIKVNINEFIKFLPEDYKIYVMEIDV